MRVSRLMMAASWTRFRNRAEHGGGHRRNLTATGPARASERSATSGDGALPLTHLSRDERHRLNLTETRRTRVAR